MSEFREPELWKHQDNGFKRAVHAPEFGFIFDAGTGKTLTTIKVLRHKFAKHNRVLKTIIFAPLITLDNWKKEWLMFSRVEDKRVVVLDSPSVEDRMKLFIKTLETVGQNVIFITSYDSIIMNKGAKYNKLTRKYTQPLKQTNADKFFRLVMEWGPEVLVSDESHRCADGQSKRAKTLKRIAKITKYRYILTGTFMPNSEMDVFSQFCILDNGATFGENFLAFRSMYFYNATPEAIAPKWVLQPHMEAEFKRKIAAKTLTALKEECIDLPELIEVVQPVTLTLEQARMYDEMKRDLITFLEDDAVVAEIAITKMLRLAQICSGFVKTDTGETIRIPTNKPKVLEEILSDLKGKKVIIWAVFHEDYKIIGEVCDKLKIKYREGHGLVNDKLKQIEEFKNDPDICVLIGNPASIGEGINIKEAGYRIYYDRDFSSVKREQSAARNYRGGSIDYHDKIYSIDLVIKGTIDETTLQVAKKKLKRSREILTLIKETL